MGQFQIIEERENLYFNIVKLQSFKRPVNFERPVLYTFTFLMFYKTSKYFFSRYRVSYLLKNNLHLLDQILPHK